MTNIFPRALLLFSLFSLVVSVAFAQSGASADTPSSIGFQTLYNFTGGTDGCCIEGGLARDRAGNLYGAAYANDNLTSYGDLFKLTRTNGAYRLRILQDTSTGFAGCSTTPTFDDAGNLFGVCTLSGTGYGTLWEYSNHGVFSVLHTFNGPTDGADPEDSVAFDNAGNIYGTAYSYGPGGGGTLWKYSTSSGAFTVLHAFSGTNDGSGLPAGPRIDGSGTIWGTTTYGPGGCSECGYGTLWNYDLHSGTFTSVFYFGVGIIYPQSRLALDPSGNLYGTAFGDTQNNCGLVYELQKSNNYGPVIVYSFSGTKGDGCSPFGDLISDTQGNLFGTAYYGGSTNHGAIYELSPINGVWLETILHSFTLSDGSGPNGALVTDGAGNWLGATTQGGRFKQGTVFEISGAQ